MGDRRLVLRLAPEVLDQERRVGVEAVHLREQDAVVELAKARADLRQVSPTSAMTMPAAAAASAYARTVSGPAASSSGQNAVRKPLRRSASIQPAGESQSRVSGEATRTVPRFVPATVSTTRDRDVA